MSRQVFSEVQAICFLSANIRAGLPSDNLDCSVNIDAVTRMWSWMMPSLGEWSHQSDRAASRNAQQSQEKVASVLHDCLQKIHLSCTVKMPVASRQSLPAQLSDMFRSARHSEIWLKLIKLLQFCSHWCSSIQTGESRTLSALCTTHSYFSTWYSRRNSSSAWCVISLRDLLHH